MEQKRVSFKVAKAIKMAGYEGNNIRGLYYNDKGESLIVTTITDLLEYYTPAPTYFDVYLWLWREKNIYIDIIQDITLESVNSYIHYDGMDFDVDDPEEAIIAAIEYLVDNDLIK